MTVERLIEDGLIDPARKLDAKFYELIFNHFEETGDDSLDPVLKALAMQMSYTLSQIPKHARRHVMKVIGAAILKDAAAIEKNMRENPGLAAIVRGQTIQ